MEKIYRKINLEQAKNRTPNALEYYAVDEETNTCTLHSDKNTWGGYCVDILIPKTPKYVSDANLKKNKKKTSNAKGKKRNETCSDGTECSPLYTWAADLQDVFQLEEVEVPYIPNEFEGETNVYIEDIEESVTSGTTDVTSYLLCRYKNLMSQYYWLVNVFVLSLTFYMKCNDGFKLLAVENQHDFFSMDVSLYKDLDDAEDIPVGDICCVSSVYDEFVYKYRDVENAKNFYNFVNKILKEGLKYPLIGVTPYLDVSFSLTSNQTDMGVLSPLAKVWEPNKKYFLGETVLYNNDTYVLGRCDVGDYEKYELTGELLDSVLESIDNDEGKYVLVTSEANIPDEAYKINFEGSTYETFGYREYEAPDETKTILYLNDGSEVELVGDTITIEMINPYREKIVGVQIGYDVTTIGFGAFYMCLGLTNIIIPSSVTDIEKYAFYGCYNMTDVTLPNTLNIIEEYTFLSCNSLSGVTIPSSVTSIGSYAFEACALTSIDIPSSVTSIDNYAFDHCTGLTSVTLHNGLISIGAFVFAATMLQKIIIPDSVTNIDTAILSGSPFVTSITVDIGNTVYDSRDNCDAIIETGSNTLIQGCNNTVIPSNVTIIGDMAFAGCALLPSITIPSSVTSIGNSAFYGCTGLTSIDIPSSVTSIDNYAFSGCRGITSVVFPDSVTNIGVGAFAYCSSLNSITIPSGVSFINNWVFELCTSLTSIVIPNNITSIHYGAFYGCTGLASINIPDSVTSIGDEAFYGCSGLTSITIPNSVTSIGIYAFNNVPHIEYYGTATGAPWGALSMN